MSLSNPTNHIPNPAEKNLEWHGKKANFFYYDKVTEKEVTLPLPFSFICLDQLSCVKGFCEVANSGIWSNEVRNTTTDPLVVKTFKGGFCWKGLYQNIKAEVKEKGGKFNKSIYAAIRLQGFDKFVMVNIVFHGAALQAWSDFCKKNREHVEKEGGVVVKGFKAGKKGGVEFVVPIFEIKEMTQQSTKDEAIEMDKQLQKYLANYLTNKPDPESESEPTETFVNSDEPQTEHFASDAVDDLPF